MNGRLLLVGGSVGLGILTLALGCGDDGNGGGSMWVAPDTDGAADTSGGQDSAETGDGTGGGSGEQGSARPDVPVMPVPGSVSELDVELDCVSIDAGETLDSVSPQGQAWLTRAQESGLGIRVFDAQGGSVGVVADETLEVGVLRSLQAWDAESAAALTSDGLWALDGFARVQVTPPGPMDADTSMCGDLSRDGLLLADGVLYERRADDNWWQWDSGAQGDREPREIVRYGGDCFGVEDIVWLTAADGTLWQVTDADVTRPARFPELVDAAATTGTVALLESETLWIAQLEEGELSWQAWSFSAGVPTGVTAAQGALWMLAGDDLLRHDGEDWQRVGLDVAGSFDRVLAHPGGVWLAGESELCSVSTQDTIRVEGVRPYLRGIESEYLFRVRSEAAAVVASVDGQDIALTIADEGAYEGRVVFETLGWHELVLTAGDATSTVPIKRVPDTVRQWSVDIAPLVESSCAGGACHGVDMPTSPRALDNYDVWRESADAIRTRVVEAQTMPPPGQGDGWDSESVEIVAQWIEGGMLP